MPICAVKPTKMKYKDFKCSCGCAGRLRICEIWKDVGSVEINVKQSGEKYWEGVVLSKEDLQEALDFIDKLNQKTTG